MQIERAWEENRGETGKSLKHEVLTLTPHDLPDKFCELYYLEIH
ncbi:MAG: hypothetical protein ABGX42_04640 [Gammaproteobacteria bacterium]|jgi:hypothetical protein